MNKTVSLNDFNCKMKVYRIRICPLLVTLESYVQEYIVKKNGVEKHGRITALFILHSCSYIGNSSENALKLTYFSKSQVFAGI